MRLLPVLTVAALAIGFDAPTALAQQGSPGWFVPGQQQQQRPAQPQPRPPARQPAGSAPEAATGFGPAGGQQADPIPMQQLQVQLPPAPEVPAIAKGPTPPAAIIGVLSVPDVLRISTAYQVADKELAQRRQKLNEDAQQEQIALRDLGQAFVNERAKLTPDQIRAKERDYQTRVNESRRKFEERNRIIQEAGQYVMAQIDRTLELVAHEVSLSRGVNLVLNRAQLLGTTAEFDLTPQVGEVMNQVLPSVVIPPDGVSPLAMTPPPGAEAAKAQPAGGAKPPKKN